MNEKPILVIRLYEKSVIASFESKNQYDDIPSLAAEICKSLDLKISSVIDGPSERIVEFDEPSLVLVNNPYGTELRGKSPKANMLIKTFCDIFLQENISK